MLSIEKTRELLGDENIHDEEVLAIMDNLYWIAEFAFKKYYEKEE